MTWRCDECGREHDENDPPCEVCGNETFERVADESSTVRPERFEWVCQECGRGHPKHSPPCSRCGHMSLEKEPIRYDLSDAEASSYLELGKWHIAAVVVLVGLVGLVWAGVISIPQIDGDPHIEDAPGEEEYAAGIDLAEAESAFLDEINAYREESGQSALEPDSDLDAVVTYHNRHRALAAADADVSDPSFEEDYAEFDRVCYGQARGEAMSATALDVDGDIDAYDDEEDLGETIAAGLTDSLYGLGIDDDWDAAGVDFHVRPDGTVLVVYLLC